MDGRLARGLRRTAALALLCAAVLCVGAPAAGACGAANRSGPAVKKGVPGGAPLVIGDSVLLGAVRQVAREGYAIDVRGCRQMREGVGLIRARRRAGGLPRFVVIALGTNASISPGEIRAALRAVGPKRLLGLVTPRETGGISGSDTRVVRQAGRRYPRRVLVLDWVASAQGHPGWFAGDGIHLGPGGAAGIARLLGRGLRKAFPLRAMGRRLGGPRGSDP